MPEAKTIYVIDDDSALRTAYVAELSKRGYHVSQAEDGQAGLELVQAKQPDLIVLDMLMPRMNGMELLRTIQADTSKPRCKVVVISSFESAPEDDSVTIDKYMSKMQFDPEEVGAAVDTLLKNS